MKDKETIQAAKNLLRLAKEHPDWYSKKDVFYAKQVKKQLKREKKHPDWYSKKDVYYAKMIKKREKQHERELSNSNPKGRGDNGVRGKSEQPKESGQPKGSWVARLLYKARSLVSL